jgi:hypothetical protein
MAYFGAPIPSADHAVQAVNTAVDIMRATATGIARSRRASRRRARHRHPHRPVVVGNIGSIAAPTSPRSATPSTCARLEKRKPGEIR